MENNKVLITKQELIDKQFMITKKFVVIDSSLYTPEAFEYIKELITFAGSIMFISDTKKIFARGKYFGGDIFEADLLYFTQFETYNEYGNLTGQTDAKHAKSTLEFRGGKHVDLLANYDSVTGNNSINIDYNLDRAVNKERFTIEENAQYNLGVVDGQLKMIKYIPANVKLSSLPLLEYDSGDTEICIDYIIIGTNLLKQFDITTSMEEAYIIKEKFTDSKIYAMVPNNTDITFTIQFSDGETTNRVEVKQIWGPACLYGNAVYEEKPSETSFNNFNKYIINNNPSKTLVIEQNGEEYGWFACPSDYNVIFTDASTNLQGGWRKESKFLYYGDNTEYQVYRTDYPGLGNIKWIITKK